MLWTSFAFYAFGLNLLTWGASLSPLFPGAPVPASATFHHPDSLPALLFPSYTSSLRPPRCSSLKPSFILLPQSPTPLVLHSPISPRPSNLTPESPSPSTPLFRLSCATCSHTPHPIPLDVHCLPQLFLAPPRGGPLSAVSADHFLSVSSAGGIRRAAATAEPGWGRAGGEGRGGLTLTQE